MSEHQPDQHPYALLVCPECAANKHQNCAGETLCKPCDEIIPCECIACGRPPGWVARS